MRKLPSGMVTLPEAARMACFEAGIAGAISEDRLNAMARELSKLLTVYGVSEAATRPLTSDELQSGVFGERAGALRFPDGRPPLNGLAVTYAALLAVLKLLRPGARAASANS